MRLLLSYISLFLLFTASAAQACKEPASVCSKAGKGGFALIKKGQPVALALESTANPAVRRAVNSLLADIERVSGQKPQLIKDPKVPAQPLVVIGVAGQSPLIDGLVAAGKLDLKGIAGEWEAYKVAVLERPWPEVEQALVIVGSDRRGAVFGTYDLSERLGVSPWHWFADVAPKRKKKAYITAGQRIDMPKVRYRGIFINDEDPAFSGWARKKFGGVNSAMYEPVFELILRLKGNYLWPAMWGKAIHSDDPKSTVLADNMGIVVGSSHHEPLMRAHAEWRRWQNQDPENNKGPWNYNTNAETLRRFWRGGIERMMSKGGGSAYDSLVTVGMRGDGDEAMSEDTAIEVLERVVADQRKIIAQVTGKPADQTPQTWALYKEVQDYYDQGMTVPDDVTLLFADDNWGQVRCLPTKDLYRSGGFGVYYHFDYVGGPRSYKWLNNTQIEKVWQQMDLSYARGARTIWVVNVGDLKPMEYPTDFFLRMAWNPEQMGPEALEQFPRLWASRNFEPRLAAKIGDLITRYSRHAARRKPELLDEQTYPIGELSGDKLQVGELGEIVRTWRQLVADTDQVQKRLSEEHQHAFFQLVEHPIKAMATLYELYHAVAWNHYLADKGDPRANYFKDKAEQAFKTDAELTEKYHRFNDGKWDGMMNQVHIGYTSWKTPKQQLMPELKSVESGGDAPLEVIFDKSKYKPKNTFISAAKFSRKSEARGLKWLPVKSLGSEEYGMIAYPQGKPATQQQDAMGLEYGFSAKQTGPLEIKLHLGPTLDTLGKGALLIGVSLDDGPMKLVDADMSPTNGTQKNDKERAWVSAAKSNNHVVSVNFRKVQKGRRTLKIWRLDDNIIFQKIEIVR